MKRLVTPDVNPVNPFQLYEVIRKIRRAAIHASPFEDPRGETTA